MKPAPAPNVPGNTPAERMDSAVRMMFSVPKGPYLKQEARLKQARGRKRAAKNHA
ncbi:MAG: hypothetical protein ABSG26_09045 [Bryobacteraceae bacterium]